MTQATTLARDEAALGDLPVWDLTDLYAAPRRAGDRRRPRLARGRVRGLRRATTRAGSPRSTPPACSARSAAGRRSRRGAAGSAATPACATTRTPPTRSAPRRSATCRRALTDATTPLVFFTLELNRIDDAALDATVAADPGARALQAGARPHPQDEAAPALRRARALPARPVGGRRRRLEPAVRRDPRRPRASTSLGETLPARGHARPALRPRPREAPGRRRGARRGLPGQPAALRPRHQHARQGEGDRGPLAQAADAAGRPPPRQRRRARGGRRRCATPSSPPTRGSRTATTR